ncbi:MAG: RNA polymerase sigma factor [bacterium]|nr:RNA polymerase sigma factor [bacterium]
MNANAQASLPDERALVQRARTEPDAFRVLYQHYFPRVYAYVAYRVNTAQDAEDLTAEIFLRVVVNLAQFEQRGEGAFAAWLFSIARHRLMDEYRRRRQILQTVSLDDLPEINGEEGDSPDALLLRKERFVRLRQMIATLSPRRQEVITLRFFAELRNQEIAEVLGLDERTVASHLTRALEDLGQRYRHELEGKP